MGSASRRWLQAFKCSILGSLLSPQMRRCLKSSTGWSETSTSQQRMTPCGLSLRYPFTLGRTIEELEESRRFCPIDIDYDVAVAEDPALIDKTYNCDGICANMCTACWYNG